MKFEHKVTGFEEFGVLLKELPKNVENNVLQGAVIRALRSVLPGMKAPGVAPQHKPDVARSAASKAYGTLRSNLRVARLRRVKKRQKGARLSTGRAFWGFILEKGSRYIPPNPWFEPYINRSEPEIFKVLGKEIGAGIEREAKKFKGGRK